MGSRKSRRKNKQKMCEKRIKKNRGVKNGCAVEN